MKYSRASSPLSILLIVLTLVACTSGAEDGKVYSEIENAEVSESFHQHSGIVLPEKAKVFYHESDRGIDTLYRIAFKVSANEFSSWISQFLLSDDMFEDSKRYLLGGDSGAWTPSKYKLLPTAQVAFENGKVMVLGRALSSENELVVFLVFHGT